VTLSDQARPVQAPGRAGDARSSATRRHGRPRRAGARGEGRAGWLFVAPAVLVMLVFIVAPVLMALWVSLLRWDGQSSPFGGSAAFVGAGNYADLLTRDGLLRQDFSTSLRNTLYYVALDVPLVTVLSFGLALAVNQRLRGGTGFFRTVFYFPSITSSVAIGVTFLFLFSGSGAVNAVLAIAGIHGPAWFTDSRGLLQIAMTGSGLVNPAALPGWLDARVLSLSAWNWLAGPSVAMMAIITLTVWSSSGTFMLFFLAGLQNIPVDVEEAAAVDGASAWQRFRLVKLPLMRRSVVLVITLALIGSWQVFDQVYVMSQGSPGKTTLTPAFLSYQRSFGDGSFGPGAAIAFVLFGIVIVFTAVQRWIGREREAS
jgi:multiple sugar transport system permease protein